MQSMRTGGGAAVPGLLIKERFFRGIVLSAVMIVSVLLLAMVISLVIRSWPSIKEFGFGFFTGSTWDPVTGEFGALPFIVGTLMTSILALLISLPFAFAVAVFLGEYFTSGPVSGVMNSVMELLAGIPSIIYGTLGLFLLSPLVAQLQKAIGIPPYGVGIFTAALLLAIMIIPYSASIAREVIRMVPQELKEAAYSLGATRMEVVFKVILPYSASGIFAGILLSFGRALGETMAVTMVIGNSYMIPRDIFGPGNTIASVIANEFTEATDPVYLSSLIEIGLVLFIITVVFGILGRFIINRMSVRD